ncbi:uncharacterized protein LOC120278880 [Dioscorea cayenensis subsp. rotundata]|uniref:Uncharacterized protein LOC120278880 n=1 Tax=Dioscorea cayennensis subsp. rotundata TaxID=55577 RepID=A0AB40CNH5_DIOCR|nr:uncharacterized protein LOC120278880 [Dioscorea cayenensis subsp. rotundata]
MFKASIIVATGSFGKGRCDHIFKNRRPNFGWIAWKAVDHVHEFRRMPTNNMGCWQIPFFSSPNAEIKALIIAIHNLRTENINIARIFISSQPLMSILNNCQCLGLWFSQTSVANLYHLLSEIGNPRIDMIPWNWNKLAYASTWKGFSSPDLSLFHKSLDLPRWLMKAINNASFVC